MARGGFESLLPLLFHYLGAQHAFSGAQSYIDYKSTKNRESSDKEVNEKEKMRRR